MSYEHSYSPVSQPSVSPCIHDKQIHVYKNYIFIWYYFIGLWAAIKRGLFLKYQNAAASSMALKNENKKAGAAMSLGAGSK